MDSILTSIKKMLGISEEYEHFDSVIIMHINSVFMMLNQIGVGPTKGFRIIDAEAKWTDYLGDSILLEAVKDYIHLRVRLLFDAASLSGPVIQSIKETIAELEWRLNVMVDTEPSAGPRIDYNDLINKPTINGEPLEGNYDEQDPNVNTMDPSKIESSWEKIF